MVRVMRRYFAPYYRPHSQPPQTGFLLITHTLSKTLTSSHPPLPSEPRQATLNPTIASSNFAAEIAITLEPRDHWRMSTVIHG